MKGYYGHEAFHLLELVYDKLFCAWSVKLSGKRLCFKKLVGDLKQMKMKSVEGHTHTMLCRNTGCAWLLSRI